MTNIQPQVEKDFNSQFNLRFLHSVNALPHPFYMECILGKRINERLKALGGRKKGKTQAWIAENLGVSDETVSKWVLGKSQPTVPNLRSLARLLQCTTGYLLGDEQNEDIAAITLMAAKMSEHERRTYRKSGAGILEPDKNDRPGKKAG